MFEDSLENSPSSPAIDLAPVRPGWQLILQGSNQVVLYNPTSHALTIQRHAATPSQPAHIVRRAELGDRCPYCHRPFSPADGDHVLPAAELEEVDSDLEDDPPSSRVANYFQLLQIANESASMPSTPRSSTPSLEPEPNVTPDSEGGGAFKAGNMAEGYFKTFFREECRLGMGANGSVFLCQHLLDGNPLGHFAVKKIAVGQSHSYLINILREVRLLEKLHHPNIVTYHHAWLETCQFSSFGPKVPTLHVLMQWAEGGSLDDFIDARLGRASSPHIVHMHPPSGPVFGHSPVASSSATVPSPAEPSPSSTPLSRSARIRAFRQLQRAPPEERERLRREMSYSNSSPGNSNDARTGNWVAVHLLSAEEVKGLFSDVVEGLAFLHDKSILHLDLKPGNVLLTWDEGRLIPRAMLSDFGTSQDMLNSRARSGNTGTLEYTSPESLPSPLGILQQIDSKSDMWSLGMILHKLLFFRLPYQYSSDNAHEDSKRDGKTVADMLEKEVQEYPGFKSNTTFVSAFEQRRLPRAFLILLEGLLNVIPSQRPSSERVLGAIRDGRLDPAKTKPRGTRDRSRSRLPLLRRGGSSGSSSENTLSPRLNGETSHTIEEIQDQSDVPTPRIPEEKPQEVPLLIMPENDEGSRESLSYVSQVKTALSPQVVTWLVERMVKSTILITKVFSMVSLRARGRLSKPVFIIALILAVMDTWLEGLKSSLVFGLLHVCVMQLNGWL